MALVKWGSGANPSDEYSGPNVNVKPFFQGLKNTLDTASKNRQKKQVEASAWLETLTPEQRKEWESTPRYLQRSGRLTSEEPTLGDWFRDVTSGPGAVPSTSVSAQLQAGVQQNKDTLAASDALGVDLNREEAAWRNMTVEERARAMEGGDRLGALQNAYGAFNTGAVGDAAQASQRARTEPTTNSWAAGGGYDTWKNRPRASSTRVMSAEEFAALTPEQQKAVQANTILHRADEAGGNALQSLLDMVGIKGSAAEYANNRMSVNDDQLAALAAPVKMGTGYRSDNDPRERTVRISGPEKSETYNNAMRILDALSTTSSDGALWRYGDDPVERALGALDQRNAAVAADTDMPMPAAIASTTFDPTMEAILGDLAAPERSGDWDAEGLLGVLQQNGMDPNAFWSFASDYIQRFESARAKNPDLSLATAGYQMRDINDLKTRLGLGG